MNRKCMYRTVDYILDNHDSVKKASIEVHKSLHVNSHCDTAAKRINLNLECNEEKQVSELFSVVLRALERPILKYRLMLLASDFPKGKSKNWKKNRKVMQMYLKSAKNVLQ